jgi:hypothetical protein
MLCRQAAMHEKSHSNHHGQVARARTLGLFGPYSSHARRSAEVQAALRLLSRILNDDANNSRSEQGVNLQPSQFSFDF